MYLNIILNYNYLRLVVSLITCILYERVGCFRSCGSLRVFLLSQRNKDCTLLSYGDGNI